MARPIKYTVDYFPHLCSPNSKTMYIIENRYGNDGYAFWFKLLETLATTEGHYFDASNPIQFEFLIAKTRFIREETPKILDLLAEIEAIDKDLWTNHKLIWCEKLVNNVADVYRLRKGLLPQKPYFLDGKLLQNIQSNGHNPVSNIINTQSKLNKTKVNEIKSNNKDTDNFTLPEWIDIKTWNEYLDMRKKIKKPATCRAMELVVKTLCELKDKGDEPNAVLNQSILHNWIDVYALKNNGESINGTNRGYSQKSQSVKAIPGNRPAGAFDDIK